MNSTIPKANAAALRRGYGKPQLAPKVSGIHAQTRSRRSPPVCLAGSLLVGDSSIKIATQIISASAWAAAAWIGFRLKLEQDRLDSRKGQKECDTCHGTGYVECICTRWNDGDVGCSTCRGTTGINGKMICNSCGGGGMAVPIEAKVYIKPERDYMNRRNL